jgi:hypothetical protein
MEQLSFRHSSLAVVVALHKPGATTFCPQQQPGNGPLNRGIQPTGAAWTGWAVGGHSLGQETTESSS